MPCWVNKFGELCVIRSVILVEYLKQSIFRIVLDATLSHHASFTWRSILSSIALVKEGLIQRIGNGNRISVWGDIWIPRDGCCKPFTPNLYGLGDIFASNFPLPNGQGWDLNALGFVFWEDDIKDILRIPVGCPTATDIRIWFFTENCYYSVQTRYYVARNVKHKQAVNNFSSSSDILNKKDCVVCLECKGSK